MPNPDSRLFVGLHNHPIVLLTLTALFWGGNAVAGRLAVGEVSPMMLTGLRWLLVCAIFLPMVGPELRREWPVLRPRLVSIIVMGLLGFTGFNALFYIAAYYTEATNIGIIQGSIPVFVLAGALIAFRTPVRLIQAVGIAVTVIGVIVVAIRGDAARLATLSFNLGDSLMVLACLFYSAYTIALKKRPAISGLVFFAAVAVVALAGTLPLVAIEVALGQASLPTVKGWGILLYVAVFPSILGQIFYVRGVDLVGPGRAGLFVNLVPVFAAILAVVILGERFAFYHGIALALVLGGIWLAERGKADNRGLSHDG